MEKEKGEDASDKDSKKDKDYAYFTQRWGRRAQLSYSNADYVHQH